MYGIITGISDTDDIEHCPKCGSPIYSYCGDGIAECEACGFRFGVVECDGEEDHENML